MFIDVFLEAFNRQKNNEAIIWKENIFSYSDLINKIKLKKHCKEKLKKFMIPIKITFNKQKQYNYRFKKIKKRN